MPDTPPSRIGPARGAGERAARVLLVSAGRLASLDAAAAAAVARAGADALGDAPGALAPPLVDPAPPLRSRAARDGFYWAAALSKAAYASREGYGFALLASDDFASELGGRTGEFAKPAMLRHALDSPELCDRGRRCEWIAWVDADAWCAAPDACSVRAAGMKKLSSPPPPPKTYISLALSSSGSTRTAS